MKQLLKPYPTYKDSSVPWLGEVPEHWGVLPNRALFSEVRERDHPEEQMLSVTITQGVVRQKVLLDGSSKKDSSNLDRSAYKLLQPGDIAYNKMRAWQGAIGLSSFRGIISPAYVVQRPRNGSLPEYFHYLFRTPAFAQEAERWSYGITSDMWSLRPEHFRLIYSCLPQAEEQLTIVRYLDYMDRRIQRYIRAKQKLIKLLEEQKQAIIHQAVTGRIDVRTGKPYPAYKPSGVEWLGDVPEHWEMLPNRALLQLQKSLVGDAWSSFPLLSLTKQGIILRDMENPEGKFPTSFEAYQEVRPGDLIFCLFDIDETPRAIGLSSLHGMITGAYTRFSCDPDFVRWVSAFYHAMDNGKRLKPLYSGLRKVITKSAFLGAKMPFPETHERELILKYLEVIMSDLSNAARHAQCEIDLLTEYRTSLISDVVTGKLDVREAAAILPDELEEDLPDDQDLQDEDENAEEVAECLGDDE